MVTPQDEYIAYEPGQVKPDDTDTITFLETHGKLVAAKRIKLRAGEPPNIKSFDNLKHYNVHERIVGSIREAAPLLSKAEKFPRYLMIRGQALPGIDRKNALKRMKPGDDEPACFEAASHYLIMLDLDKVECPEGFDQFADPEATVGLVVAGLPLEFHDVSCWWQFTASAGIAPGINMRLGFWGSRPTSDEELKAWLPAVDPAVFHPVQAIYIANPIFDEGVDPVPVRSALFIGERDVVEVPDEFETEDLPRLGYKGWCALIGDHADGKGFHRPTKAAIAVWVGKHGAEHPTSWLRADIEKAIRGADHSGHRDGYIEEKVEELDGLIAWTVEREAKKSAAKREARKPGGDVSFDDFYAYMPMHNYIYVPTGTTWPAESVNAQLGKGANERLDRKKPVMQMIWVPGLPKAISGRLLLPEGGWIDKPGATGFNLYHPSTIVRGSRGADRWVEHIRYIYPDDAEHLIDYLAHRVQRPAEKINHALVLGGEQGVGKDTLLEPVKYAVGPWNFQEASPTQVIGRFNGFLKAVILRISEARDLGEVDRFKFYEHMKSYTAAPPDVLRVDEKYLREQAVINCCGVIYTTNHKTNGIYLPPDDRRHFVAWCDLTKEDEKFQGGYWDRVWEWYAKGGIEEVAAYLLERDISGFDAKAPPPKTPAFWQMVDAGEAPETERREFMEQLSELVAAEPANPRPAEEGAMDRQIAARRRARLAQDEARHYLAPGSVDSFFKRFPDAARIG